MVEHEECVMAIIPQSDRQRVGMQDNDTRSRKDYDDLLFECVA